MSRVYTKTRELTAGAAGALLSESHLTAHQNLDSEIQDISSALTNAILNADVDAAAAIVESKLAFDTTAGHDHDGTDSKLIFPGATLKKEASVAISQAQSTTVSRLTVSGLANEDAGIIEVACGGNVGSVDRASITYTFSYYRTGGTVLFSTGVTSQATGGATSANIVIVAANSSGDIVIQTQLGGFGAGNFIGNAWITVTKNTTGLVLTP